MYFAIGDVYPRHGGNTLTTSEQTIPEHDENQYFQDNTVEDSNGMKKVSNSKMILGALGLFIGITILINLID